MRFGVYLYGHHVTETAQIDFAGTADLLKINPPAGRETPELRALPRRSCICMSTMKRPVALHKRANRAAVWILCASGMQALGQQYPFLPVEGSPKGVKSLFQDSRGRLWLGGAETAWFDGTRFFFLRDFGSPVAQSDSFSEDSAGGIWIGAETGVYRFAAGRLEKLNEGAAVSVIANSPDSAVAAIGPLGGSAPANASLFRIRQVQGEWKSERVVSLDSRGPMTLDSTGMILYPRPGKGWGEIRLKDVIGWQSGNLHVIDHSYPVFPRNANSKVMRDRSGCLWLGSDGGVGYNCGDGDHSALFPGANPRSNMHEASDASIVIWGDSLLAAGRPGSFRVATRANGLPGLVDAIQSHDGSIWLATTHGLYRFASPFRAEYWTIRDGVAEPPWSITRSGGTVYAGLDTRIISLGQDRSRWNAIPRVEGRGLIASLLGAKDGSLLVGFGDGGVVALDKRHHLLASTEKDWSTSGAMRLARDADGGVWAGGSRLAHLKREGSVLKEEEHPLNTPAVGNILAVRYDRQTQRLWACYNGGLVERDEHGVWKEFTTRDGLLTDGCWSLATLPEAMCGMRISG